MRLTVDLDYPTKYEIVKAWNGLAKHGQPHGRVSSSGTGVHIKVHGTKMSHEETLPIRLRLGDDKFRAKHDTESEIKPRQMTFTEKGTDKAGRWYQSLERTLQEYSRRADYAKTLENRGIL